MENSSVNWDAVPEYITKDQLYRICHISKQTARYLLQSGKIPCEYTGKKTRCYRIKKEDVIAYLEDRKVFPECFAAPRGWYGGHYDVKPELELPPIVKEDMEKYFRMLLRRYPDVMTTAQVVRFTGYRKTTVNNWCSKGHLPCFKKRSLYYMPKVYLIEFLCSGYFRSVVRKSDRHIQILRNFSDWQAGQI